jgi:hypothetical protein
MKIFKLLFLALCILVSSCVAEEEKRSPLQKIGSAFNGIKDKILGGIKKIAETRKTKTEEVPVETKEEIEEVVESIDEVVSEEEPESNDESGETGEVQDDNTEDETPAEEL